MADWPALDELKQILDVASNDFDGEEESGEGPTRLSRVLAAAIAKVKRDVGQWDEEADEPDDSLAAGALRMAELMATRPEANPTSKGLEQDPAYLSYIHGHRRSFGIA